MSNILFWFRNDLRLHDNEALVKAIEKGNLIPVYIFDERQFKNTRLGFKRTGILRTKFLIEAIENLKANLKNLGSDLIVKVGIPESILAEMAEEFQVSHVFASKEVTQEETSIEAELSRRLKPLNIDIDLVWQSTLYHARDLPFQIHYIPDIFTEFRKRMETKSKVRPCFETPKHIPTVEELLETQVPSLQELGFDNNEIPAADERAVMTFIGGETPGLELMNEFIWQKEHIKNYKETRNELIGKNYSSKFSAWLSLGCLSPRKIYWEVKKFESEIVENESTYWLIFELLWRDYFHFIALKFGVRMFKRSGIKHDMNKKWKRSKEQFQKWINGQTGVPFIDANMIELKTTGYMSNRGRQNVASFFTKDLGIEWWWGAMYFESQLIDYDVCINWGNWNYIAGIGNDPRDNRYFNPIKQAQNYDSEGKFVKRWLPNLASIEAENIHTPWRILNDDDYDALQYPKLILNNPKFEK